MLTFVIPAPVGALASFTDKTNSIRRETTIDEITRVGTDANFSTEYEVELDESTIEKKLGGAVTDSDRAYLREIAAEICRKEVISGFSANHATADPYPTEQWYIRTGGSDQYSKKMVVCYQRLKLVYLCPLILKLLLLNTLLVVGLSPQQELGLQKLTRILQGVVSILATTLKNLG